MDRIRAIETNRFNAKIRFDDGSMLTVRKKDVERHCLSADMDVDAEALKQRICASQFPDGYEAALDILDRSARTKQEIRKKLLFKGYLSEVADAVCEKLVESRLIDDNYIAERIVSSMTSSGRGRYAVAQKLRARGIEKEDSEAALESISDEEQASSARSLALKLMKKYSSLDKRQRKQKLSQALARRGFSWDSIESALSVLEEDEE